MFFYYYDGVTFQKGVSPNFICITFNIQELTFFLSTQRFWEEANVLNFQFICFVKRKEQFLPTILQKLKKNMFGCGFELQI